MTPAKFESVEALRRVPKQGRGQRRVEHILKSAEALFAEVGFDNATTNAVAARAGVSIGSLYQFFESKDAILEAVASRYLDQSRKMLQQQLATVTSDDDIETFTGSLLELLIKLQEARPYYLQCLGWTRPSPILNKRVDELFEFYSTHVADALGRIGSEADQKLLALRARICIQTVGVLLPLALYARGKDRIRNTKEIQTLIVNYLKPTLTARESR
jgi:AcrR family transcriptional regulator